MLLYRRIAGAKYQKGKGDADDGHGERPATESGATVRAAPKCAGTAISSFWSFSLP
jgi:hypothetical protein